LTSSAAPDALTTSAKYMASSIRGVIEAPCNGASTDIRGLQSFQQVRALAVTPWRLFGAGVVEEAARS
jgi:hypothetical protein